MQIIMANNELPEGTNLSKFILQLSEMAADLAEEHSTATLATERLEGEQAERMKLEKDRGDLEVSAYLHTYYLLDVLWGQPIKLIQVASNSELHENQ